MHIRTAENILEKFTEQLQDCDAADIAVAWATHGPAINELRAFCERKGKLRIVVGIGGNVTDPSTLRDLDGFADLRIGVARSPASKLFHPKYYCFHKSSRSTVWVGSANLTNSAFGSNEELMLETRGTRNSLEWFESLWNALPSNAQSAIDEYAKRWKPQFDDVQPSSRITQPTQSQWPAPTGRLDSSWTWNDFVAGLRATHANMLSFEPDYGDPEEDVPFSVFGEYRSWMHTIRVGHPITRQRSWRNLRQWQKEVLVGNTPWGSLGHLGAAGKAQGYIKRDDQGARAVRKHILSYLRSTTEDKGEPIRRGVRAIEGIRKVNGLGPGVATRFLALTRPECYVSLNSASRDGLAQSSGLAPSTLDRRYGELLEWVHGSKWYNVPRPSDSIEAEIWDYRAALIDALVYDSGL